jgi:hypothetical protein
VRQELAAVRHDLTADVNRQETPLQQGWCIVILFLKNDDEGQLL